MRFCVPIGMVIEELSLAPDIKAQLLCAKTGKRTPFRRYDLMWRAKPATGNASRTWGTAQLSLSFVAETSNEAMRWRTKSPAPRARSALLNRAEADTLSTTPLPQAGLPWCEGRG